MAIYDNLPVFKQAYDLLLQILRFTSSVQRDFRYTVGETLKKDVIELCLCIYRANASVEKLPQIEAATVSFMTQRMTLTFADGADEAAVLAAVKKTIARVEPDCEVLA